MSAPDFSNVVVLGTPVTLDLIFSQADAGGGLFDVCASTDRETFQRNQRRLVGMGLLRVIPEDGPAGRWTARGEAAAKFLNAIITEAGAKLCVPPEGRCT